MSNNSSKPQSPVTRLSKKKTLSTSITMASWWWTPQWSLSSKTTKTLQLLQQTSTSSTTTVTPILNMRRTSNNSSERYVCREWQKSSDYLYSSIFTEKTEKSRIHLWKLFTYVKNKMRRYRRNFRKSPTRFMKTCTGRTSSSFWTKVKAWCSRITVSLL